MPHCISRKFAFTIRQTFLSRLHGLRCGVTGASFRKECCRKVEKDLAMPRATLYILYSSSSCGMISDCFRDSSTGHFLYFLVSQSSG